MYFRKSNPPEEDWQRDYQQAAADGMNCFRHWFLWSAIEVAPGEYDWADYDRQLDLAAENGIKTIIADILGTAPEWAFRKYPHARVESADGSKAASRYTAACAVGGAPGLCLDNEEVKQQAENFLRAMVTRYRNHPGLGGYDVWNELNMNGGSGGCYCEASAEKFRQWLKAKYGTLAALNKAWYRYSYASWDDVQIPRTNDPYPDSMDWALFRIDNAMRLFKWRVGIIRSLDSHHPVTAHAIPLGVIEKIGPQCYPVFQVGKLVDVYGYSGGCNHDERTKLRWMHWCNMDMTRSAAQGKPFWWRGNAGGFLVALAAAEDGRRAHDHRLGRASYSMMHFAGGAQGVFSPRWRPLLDGRFAGYFGFYDLDGSPTERSAAAGHMARWANAPSRNICGRPNRSRAISTFLSYPSRKFTATLRTTARSSTTSLSSAPTRLSCSIMCRPTLCISTIWGRSMTWSICRTRSCYRKRRPKDPLLGFNGRKTHLRGLSGLLW